MYPRTNYEMTEEDLKVLLDACKPTPCMLIGGFSPPSPQENANRAWEKLGEKMGFDPQTVRPIPGKGNRFFSAIPCENEIQRKERIDREEKEENERKIEDLIKEIAEKQILLQQLKNRNKE